MIRAYDFPLTAADPYPQSINTGPIVFVLERVTDLVEGGSLFYSYGLAGRYYDALISSDEPVPVQGNDARYPEQHGP